MAPFNSIALTQFKNYSFQSFQFKERIVGIIGLNGKGKTNLLDAIYYCCFTKSYFNTNDQSNIQFNADGFRIEADIDNQKLIFIHRGTGKKELSLDNIPYEKMSEHIGRFPAVMIAPDDIELVTGGSEIRRKFIDSTLSQINTEYLQLLIKYNKILQQRNSLLKQFADQGKRDIPLLEALNFQLIQYGQPIYEQRTIFLAELIPLISFFYEKIAGQNEHIGLLYESHLHHSNYSDLLKKYQEKDFILMRTNGGIHKDEIEILLQGQSFKNTASQGQRKSLLFALKLAAYELIKSKKGFPPVLLLDDIFEKLDMNRMNNLLQWVCCENSGQVFITDTHEDRVNHAFQQLKIPFQLITLD